jgi:hypothetical protein
LTPDDVAGAELPKSKPPKLIAIPPGVHWAEALKMNAQDITSAINAIVDFIENINLSAS